MQPSTVVSLVHGTFAPGASWTRPESPLRRRLESLLGDAVAIECFDWSGKNSIPERREAARELANHLERLQDAYPSAQQVVIAHSHGGNVALYAAEGLDTTVQLTGIACLATPFFHAKARDIKHLSARSLEVSAFALLALLSAVVPNLLFELSYSTLTVSFLLSAFVGIIAGRVLWAGIQKWAPLAHTYAAAVQSQVHPDTKLLILRKPGDEASFALATGQFLSWLTTRSFASLMETERNLSWATSFKKRSLPKWVWSIWAVSALCLVPVAVFDIRSPAGFALVYAGLKIFAIALCVTIVVKTTWLDRYLLGAATLAMILVGAVMSALIGTVPHEPTFAPGFPRSVEGALLAILVEVHTEATPVGAWTVVQLDDDGRSHPKSDRGRLVHSIYEDGHAIEHVARWVAQIASSTRPSGPDVTAQGKGIVNG